MKLYFLLIFLWTFMVKAAESKDIVVEIKMAPNTITRIRYTNDNYDLIPLTYKNQDTITRIVKKSFQTSKPTVIRFSIQTSDTTFSHRFLCFPNDSVRLTLSAKNDIVFDDPKGSYFFLEDIFPDINAVVNFNNIEEAGNSELQSAVIRSRSQQLIDSILKVRNISTRYSSYLLSLAEHRLLLERELPLHKENKSENFLRDELSFLLTFEKEFSLLNATEFVETYENLLNFLLQSRQSSSLMQYVSTVQRIGFNYFSKILIRRKLEKWPEKTSKDYQNALSLIEDSIGLLSEKSNNLNQLLEVELQDQKRKVTFKQLTDSFPPGKLIVLDFWATWCLPCIEQFAYLEKRRTELSKHNILFLTLSLDTDENHAKWLKANDRFFSKKEISLRVSSKDSKKIANYFNIATIPRFIVLDSKSWAIINNDLNLPSTPEFTANLLKYLNEYSPN